MYSPPNTGKDRADHHGYQNRENEAQPKEIMIRIHKESRILTVFISSIQLVRQIP